MNSNIKDGSQKNFEILNEYTSSGTQQNFTPIEQQKNIVNVDEQMIEVSENLRKFIAINYGIDSTSYMFIRSNNVNRFVFVVVFFFNLFIIFYYLSKNINKNIKCFNKINLWL